MKNRSFLLNETLKFDLNKNPLICDCADCDVYMQMKTKHQMSETTNTVYCLAPLVWLGCNWQGYLTWTYFIATSVI